MLFRNQDIIFNFLSRWGKSDFKPPFQVAKPTKSDRMYRLFFDIFAAFLGTLFLCICVNIIFTVLRFYFLAKFYEFLKHVKSKAILNSLKNEIQSPKIEYWCTNVHKNVPSNVINILKYPQIFQHFFVCFTTKNKEFNVHLAPPQLKIAAILILKSRILLCTQAMLHFVNNLYTYQVFKPVEVYTQKKILNFIVLLISK